MEAPTTVGLEMFVNAVTAQRIPVEQRGGLVIYRLIPLTGAASGSEVETGLAVEELSNWPTSPPHWVHVPNHVQLPGGSQQASEHDGWSKYSRPHPGRLDASPAPAREWIAHVRALLGTAT